MRIVFFGNGSVSFDVLRWLIAQNEDIVGLVLHPLERCTYGDEMLEAAQIDSRCVFDGSQLGRPDVLHAISELKPDIGLSVYFGYLLNRELLEVFPLGCLNLHPAFLPYNRGAYPNVWSIVERTPSGVTLHYMDEGVDTGDVIAQREVPVDPVDTGETLYRKLGRTGVQLFAETWPIIKSGRAARHIQTRQLGTIHRVGDVKGIDEIDLDGIYRARDLIDVLRARTFPPHHGAYFRHNDQKIYLNLQLQYEDEI